MEPKSSASLAALAGVIGSSGGMAVAGFVHSLLPQGSVWVRAALTGASGAIGGGLVALIVVWIAARKS